MIDTLRNPEILAVDQDPLAIQGVRVATDATGDVYSKVLQGSGKRAVVLLNRSDTAAERTVTFADAGMTGRVSVRDLRARQDRGHIHRFVHRHGPRARHGLPQAVRPGRRPRCSAGTTPPRAPRWWPTGPADRLHPRRERFADPGSPEATDRGPGT